MRRSDAGCSVPIARGHRLEDRALDGEGEAELASEGVYVIEGPAGTYVGQSGDIARRLAEHTASGMYDPGTDKVVTIAVDGGKTAREIVEQKVIDQLGGIGGLEEQGQSDWHTPIRPHAAWLLEVSEL